MKDLTLRVVKKVYHWLNLPSVDNLDDARVILFRELARDDDEREARATDSGNLDRLIRLARDECRAEDKTNQAEQLEQEEPMLIHIRD